MRLFLTRLLAKLTVEWELLIWTVRTTKRYVFDDPYPFSKAPLWFVKVMAAGELPKEGKQRGYVHAAKSELIRRIGNV